MVIDEPPTGGLCVEQEPGGGALCTSTAVPRRLGRCREEGAQQERALGSAVLEATRRSNTREPKPGVCIYIYCLKKANAVGGMNFAARRAARR